MAPDTTAPSTAGGESPQQALRVVLADDDVLLRSGLARLLERPGFDVVGQAGDGRQLLELVRELVPDLVVTDIRMPPTQTAEGLDAARTIREELPDVAIMVLSAHVDVEHATTLLAEGRGIGYLLKSRVVDVDDFVDSLSRVARGASVVDPALIEELFAVRRRNDPLDALSPREHEVMALMAKAARTSASRSPSGSPRGLSRSTCAASSPNSTSTRSRRITVASWPCSPTSSPVDRRGHGDADRQRRTFTHRADDLEGAAKGVDAVGEADQTRPAASIQTACAVVPHLEPHRRRMLVQDDADVRRPARA